MNWLKHVEGLTLILAPIIGIGALIADFSWSNLLLFLILMLVWKAASATPLS